MTDILTLFHAFSAGALWLLGSLFILRINQTNVNAERWLGIFYYLMAFTFTQLFLEGVNFDYKAIIQFLELPRWATLPCLYLAVSYMVTPSTRPKHQMLHFVPFSIYFLLSMIYLMPNFFNMEVPTLELPRWIIFVIKYFFFAQSVFYWTACYLLLKKHQLNIRQLSSYTQNIDLAWVGYLIIAMLCLIITRGLAIALPLVSSLSPILYFIGIIALAYFSLTQNSIYTLESSENLLNESVKEKRKSEQRFTPEQVKLLKDNILEKTINGKLYLDPGLTLTALSEHVKLSPHDLSFILNYGLHKSFYQYINELRTEEAKGLLLSGKVESLDMSGIATLEGFNSRTTFYSSFKKVTGVTPKEFMKNHLLK